MGDVAQFALAQNTIAGLDEVGRAAALGAHLHRPAVFPGGRHHGLTLNDIHARRLLHINVRTGLAGLDHGQRVPMIGGSNEHHIQIFLRQHLPVITVGPGLLARLLPLGDQSGRVGQHAAIDIAQRNHVHRGDLNESQQIALAVPTRADQAHPQGFVLGEGRGNKGRGRQGCARLEKLSACHGLVLDGCARQLKPAPTIRLDHPLSPVEPTRTLNLSLYFDLTTYHPIRID